eukprot:13358065-Heterocapsa_arctica.AAC.1
MPTTYWPRAADAFCDHINFAIFDGDSAWNKRHREGPFKGKQVPFGALIDFRLPKPLMEKLPKFAGTSIPGIFLGYHMLSGERWSKDYLVAPLSDFKGGPTDHVRLCRVNEIVIGAIQPFIFPP